MIDLDNHGNCKNCGYDLNGENVFEHFLKEKKDPKLALEYAQMYGCKKGWGKFSKAIYLKSYDKHYNKLPSKYICPECREECY